MHLVGLLEKFPSIHVSILLEHHAMRIVITILSILIIPSFCMAATIHVPADYTKIQDAIFYAKTGDTIVVAPGTYVENINFNGKAVTVTSSGGAGATVIDGNMAGSVVCFVSGEGLTSVLDGFTLTNGTGSKVSTLWNKYCGGGIYCDNISSPSLLNNIITDNMANLGGGILCNANSAPDIIGNTTTENFSSMGGGIYTCSVISPMIKNNTIEDNYAINSGGGIYCEGSSPRIIGNEITKNSSDENGGGVYCENGAPLIDNNSITKNLATCYPNSSGGGLCTMNSDCTVTNNIISQNLSNSGGGVFCTDLALIASNMIFQNSGYLKGAGLCTHGAVKIEYNDIHLNTVAAGNGSGGGVCSWDNAVISNNKIYNNSGGYYGGGVKCEDYSTVIVEGNILHNNTADVGGGIACDTGSSPLVRNNLIYKNTAIFDGGGISSNNLCAMIAVNNTITENTAGWYAGGISCLSNLPVITNCIVWGNIAPKQVEIVGTPTVTYCDVKSGWTGVGNIDVNPQFADSSSDDFHILYGSLCMEAGDNLAPGIPSIDFEGDPRVAGHNADIGADEFSLHLYYTGQAIPGGAVTFKMIGTPGSSPVGLFASTGLLPQPVVCSKGVWFLSFPVLGPALLSPISGTGLSFFTATLPPYPASQYSIFLQALVSNQLTNLLEVYVE